MLYRYIWIGSMWKVKKSVIKGCVLHIFPVKISKSQRIRKRMRQNNFNNSFTTEILITAFKWFMKNKVVVLFISYDNCIKLLF